MGSSNSKVHTKTPSARRTPSKASGNEGIPAVVLYTDGACSGNPGPGGWGALLYYGRLKKELSGFHPATTNNRMELTAVIEALKALKKPCSVRVFTDSKYVQQGASEWMKGWKARGWRKADGKPVENLDLWQELEHALKPHTVAWYWVKGHSGHPDNERADELARMAIEDALEEAIEEGRPVE